VSQPPQFGLRFLTVSFSILAALGFALLAFHHLLRYDELIGRPAACRLPMMTRDFKVFLEPDADYGGYVVVCPSIPGCYSQGKTVPEALANIREAIDLCLEDMDSRFRL